MVAAAAAAAHGWGLGGREGRRVVGDGPDGAGTYCAASHVHVHRTLSPTMTAATALLPTAQREREREERKSWLLLVGRLAGGGFIVRNRPPVCLPALQQITARSDRLGFGDPDLPIQRDADAYGDHQILKEESERGFFHQSSQINNKMVNSSNGPAAKLLAWSADRIPFDITKNR